MLVRHQTLFVPLELDERLAESGEARMIFWIDIHRLRVGRYSLFVVLSTEAGIAPDLPQCVIRRCHLYTLFRVVHGFFGLAGSEEECGHVEEDLWVLGVVLQRDPICRLAFLELVRSVQGDCLVEVRDLVVLIDGDYPVASVHDLVVLLESLVRILQAFEQRQRIRCGPQSLLEGLDGFLRVVGFQLSDSLVVHGCIIVRVDLEDSGAPCDDIGVPAQHDKTFLLEDHRVLLFRHQVEGSI